MIEERALVVSVSLPDAFGKTIATVKTQRESACQSCQLKSGCGQGSLNQMMSGKGVELNVENTFNARQGDVVMLSIPESGLLQAATLMFLFPLLGMSIFALFTSLVFSAGEVMIAVSRLLGLGAGLVFARRSGQSLQGDARFQPSMSGIALTSPVQANCAP